MMKEENIQHPGIYSHHFESQTTQNDGRKQKICISLHG
jgi:hypothetical protein